MSYSPKRVVKKSPKGVAILKYFPERSTLAVKFVEDQRDGKPINGDFAGLVYKPTEWPEYVDPRKVSDKRWYVKLDSEGQKIFSVSPQVGMFDAVCTGFIKQKDQQPEPKEYNGKWGSYKAFAAVLEITAPEEYKGMPVIYSLRYNFMDDGEGNTTYSDWNSDKAVHSPKLDEFLMATGAWKAGPIQYRPNVLPELERRILAERKTIKFSMDRGFINALYDVPTVDVEEDEFWQDETTDGFETGFEEPTTSDFPATVEDDEPPFDITEAFDED